MLWEVDFDDIVNALAYNVMTNAGARLDLGRAFAMLPFAHIMVNGTPGNVLAIWAVVSATLAIGCTVPRAA